MIHIGNIDIPEWTAAVLMIAGIIFVCTVLVIVIVILKDNIDDCIDHKKWEHKYKHRFDKPPIAKCYCIDCKNYGRRSFNHQCFAHSGWYVADNWFCWDADPRKTDPDIKEDE